MGCDVHGQAKVWLQQTQKHHKTWEERWSIASVIGGGIIAPGSALVVVLAPLLAPFFAVLGIGVTVTTINWFLSRKGRSLVEKAIQAVLEEKDCGKAERMFTAAQKLAKVA